jgi:DNA-binding PadR family transcriptional regulator
MTYSHAESQSWDVPRWARHRHFQAMTGEGARGSRRRHRHGPPGGFGGPLGPGQFRRGRRARRGDVRAASLALLAAEPRNGYAIIQELERRTDGVWRPSPGSVYPALQQLQDEGLVRVEEDGASRIFHLTDAGKAYVEERAEELTAPWEAVNATVDDGAWQLMQLARQVGMATAQLVHVAGEAQVAEAKKVLAEARRALYRILAEEEPER